MNPPAPSAAKRRAEPFVVTANPIAESAAMTSNVGCTLSVRWIVCSKSGTNCEGAIRRQIGTRDQANVAAPPAKIPPAISMRVAQIESTLHSPNGDYVDRTTSYNAGEPGAAPFASSRNCSLLTAA